MTLRKLSISICVAILAGVAACARPYSPEGGKPDHEPPAVVSISPEPMSVVPGWDEPVVIRFDERISERRVKESVLVSPETGEIQVQKGRSELRVKLKGGWRPGQVYRVVVLPVIQDLFNNQRQHEIEVIFSTGPEIPATVLAGTVTDRITGKPAIGARVEAIRRADGDSVTYVALSDSAGFFALRHIPDGSYDIRAYMDQTRNRKPDFSEAIDVATAMLSPTDTTVLGFSLLPPDTTPARLLRAEARDSVHIQLQLDDFLDPAESLDGVTAELWLLPDSTRVEVARVIHSHVYKLEEEARKAEAAAAAAADTVGVDSTVVAGVEPEIPVEEIAAIEVEGTAEGADESEPLPARELVLISASPLTPKARYRVEVRGITNIAGLAEGGGSVVFEAPAPPPLPPPPADSADADAAPDSVPAAAPPDSVPGVQKDSLPPASLGSAPTVAPDSTPMPPSDPVPPAPTDPAPAPVPQPSGRGRVR